MIGSYDVVSLAYSTASSSKALSVNTIFLPSAFGDVIPFQNSMSSKVPLSVWFAADTLSLVWNFIYLKLVKFAGVKVFVFVPIKWNN